LRRLDVGIDWQELAGPCSSIAMQLFDQSEEIVNGRCRPFPATRDCPLSGRLATNA
jgi:hypothetical protein